MDTAQMAIIISVIGLVVQLIGIIVAGVWIVGKIQGATDKLAVSIEHLANNVESQKQWLENVDNKVDNHGERLAVVEVITEKTLSAVRSTNDGGA